MTTRIVGIDASLTSTGLAEITTDQHDDTSHRTWTVTSSGRAHPSWEQRAARLDRLTTKIVTDVLGGSNPTPTPTPPPTLVLIEGHVTGAKGDPHDRSGLWWQIYLSLRGWAPIAVVAPTTRCKFATGKGNASKLAVVSAMARRWPLDMIDSDDAWDAFVLAELGAYRLGVRMPHPLTAYQREALAAVTWPDGLRAVGAIT